MKDIQSHILEQYATMRFEHFICQCVKECVGLDIHFSDTKYYNRISRVLLGESQELHHIPYNSKEHHEFIEKLFVNYIRYISYDYNISHRLLSMIVRGPPTQHNSIIPYTYIYFGNPYNRIEQEKEHDKIMISEFEKWRTMENNEIYYTKK